MSTVPVVIVSGYLGAGKTTLINTVLAAGAAGVWVLVNDFGEVNIDASLIVNSTGTTMELTNGCICCAYDDNLADTLRRAAAAKPSMVIIETSGVADPGTLTPHTLTPGFRPGGTIVVVDGTTLPQLATDRYVGVTVTRQISAADVVVVSRTAPTEGTRSTVRAHNPSAPVLGTEEVDIASVVVLGHPAVTPRVHDNPHTTTVEHPVIETTAQALEWLASLGHDVVRAKGVTNLDCGRCLLERVGRTSTVTPTNAPVSDGVVVIRLPRD